MPFAKKDFTKYLIILITNIYHSFTILPHVVDDSHDVQEPAVVVYGLSQGDEGNHGAGPTDTRVAVDDSWRSTVYSNV